MLRPAIDGTKNMLAAAKKEPRVKHMVLTSSLVAVINPVIMPAAGITYTGDDWNPATWEQAKTIDDPIFTYCASKTLAEKAAWDDTERTFPVTAICPPKIFGPAHQPIDKMSSLNNSIRDFYSLMSNTPIACTDFPVGVDVRDVAALHVNALSSPPPPGTPHNAQRLLLPAWHYFNHEIAEVLVTSPQLSKEKTGVDFKTRVSSDRSADPGFEHFACDSGRSETLLGRSFITKKQCFVDSALRLLELEKQL